MGRNVKNAGVPNIPGLAPPGWPNRRNLVVEARTADGALVLDHEKQPPFVLASAHELGAYFFRHSNTDPDKPVTAAQIKEWFASKGWYWRPKTW